MAGIRGHRLVGLRRRRLHFSNAGLHQRSNPPSHHCYSSLPPFPRTWGGSMLSPGRWKERLPMPPSLRWPSPMQKRAFTRKQQDTNPSSAHSAAIDVARFGLLSIATLPFSLWIALFTYDYYYRVDLCRDALSYEDAEISFVRSNDPAKSKQSQAPRMIGRERQLAEVKAMLAQPPQRILVVTGSNESGKSLFVSEILRSLSLHRGITYLSLAQVVDSVSTLTHAFVRAFDLRWLHLRHSLVDVLPVAGSEIYVLKERFSDRDLAQALLVVSQALAKNDSEAKMLHKKERPVIVIDGLGVGSSWMRSKEGRASLQRLLRWCTYITKERRLAHVILTGNEELVWSLTNQNRTTRGHVRVVGLGDLKSPQAIAEAVRKELPDATDTECARIADVFGGFVHDLRSIARDVRVRLHQQQRDRVDRQKVFEEVLAARFRHDMERITAAFSKGLTEDEGRVAQHESNDEEDEEDPYLGPLKAVYSEASAAKESDEQEGGDTRTTALGGIQASWTKLQLWETIQRLTASKSTSVPFADLRDEVFGGDVTPLLELMHEDVLGFEVESSSTYAPIPSPNSNDDDDKGDDADMNAWSWEVKPATPALGLAFRTLVANSSLKERFEEIERESEAYKRRDGIERERKKLRQERRRLDARKASLKQTADLGKQLGVRRDKAIKAKVDRIYSSIVEEEMANELRGIELRQKLVRMAAQEQTGSAATTAKPNGTSDADRATIHSNHTIQELLKEAILRTYVLEGSTDKFQRFRQAFDELKRSSSSKDGEGGIRAADLCRLIKETSGQEIEEGAADDFIRAWDANSDKQLSYDEFVTMLLTDHKAPQRRDYDA